MLALYGYGIAANDMKDSSSRLWRTSHFRGDKNLYIGNWTASTEGDVPSGSRTGWGFKVDCPFKTIQEMASRAVSKMMQGLPSCIPVLSLRSSPCRHQACASTVP